MVPRGGEAEKIFGALHRSDRVECVRATYIPLYEYLVHEHVPSSVGGRISSKGKVAIRIYMFFDTKKELERNLFGLMRNFVHDPDVKGKFVQLFVQAAKQIKAEYLKPILRKQEKMARLGGEQEAPQKPAPVSPPTPAASKKKAASPAKGKQGNGGALKQERLWRLRLTTIKSDLMGYLEGHLSVDQLCQTFHELETSHASLREEPDYAELISLALAKRDGEGQAQVQRPEVSLPRGAKESAGVAAVSRMMAGMRRM